MKTRITTVAALLLAMFLVGEAVAQVPSSVTQQLRLSTGGTTPNYVNHRAITTAGAAPVANGWYAWDQVPVAATGVNYLLFLNDANEVRQSTAFNAAVGNFILTVNAGGTNIAYLDPANLVIAQNGLTEPTPNTVELGGALMHNTTIDQSGFNMTWVDSSATSSFNILAENTGTMNVNIDPGTGGVINLQNIDADATAVNFLVTTAAGNVVSRDLDGMIDANNGVTETVLAGVSTIQLGAPATGGSLLLTSRFVSLNGQNMTWEGTGNFNLGAAATNMSVNIHTGTTGNFTLAGTTLDPVAPVAANFLYTDATGNVRRADANTIPTGTAATYLAVDATGNIVNAPDPLAGIFRGRITGNNGYIYPVTGITGLLAGAAVTVTVLNGTAGLGTISAQVTAVVAGGFTVELTENIPAASQISWIAINP